MPAQRPALRTRVPGWLRTAEAMALMTAASAGQRWLPMPRWSGLLGRPAPVPVEWQGQVVGRPVPGARSALERQVGGAVAAGVRRLPGKPTCLAQAAAGQVMLRRRGSAGVVIIGLKPAPVRWQAHAWLVVESGVLIGWAASAGFTPTSVFEVPGRLRAAQVSVAAPAA